MEKNMKIIMPIVYIGIILLMILSVLLLISGIKRFINHPNSYNYTLDKVFEGEVMPVIKTENNLIIRPYTSEKVKVGKYYYDYESDFNKQKDSLIYYQNTYMQNTGVEYVCDDIFDVVSILDGEVIGIEDNKIYGKILTIKHNDNLITKYSNIDNILVNIGYKVSQGEIIAKSNKSKIDSNVVSMLHFEVKYKDEYIDPENLYTLKVSDLK